MPDELSNYQKIEEVKKKLNEIMELEGVGDFLKDNEFKFEYKGVQYKVHKPTYKEKQEAYNKRIIKYSQLLKEKNEDGSFKYSIEEDLIREYKARGIDIDIINKNIETLIMDKERLMLRLGKALKEEAPKNELDLYRKEIEKINKELERLTLKKTTLLEFSIETQVLLYFYSYLTSLVAEKYDIGKDLGEENKEEGKWVKVWNSFEEYQNADENLIIEVSYRATFLINSME